MSGIISYGVSIPTLRADEIMLQPASRKKGFRAVCFPDQDLITLACDAAKNCLSQSLNKPSAVFFATSSPVFENRYHASFLANLLSIDDSVFSLDFNGTTRSGTDALMMAAQLVDAGAHAYILVITAEVKYAPIGLEHLLQHGHAAAALLIGKEDGLAKIAHVQNIGTHISEEFIYKDSTVKYDPRFIREAGFKTNITRVVSGLSADQKKSDAIILNSPFAKMGGPVFMKAGFDAGQFATDKISQLIGNTGSTHALLLLIQSLEAGKKNILLMDVCNGTNMISLLADGKDKQKQLETHFNNGELIKNYQDYLLLRKEGNFSSYTYHSRDIFSSEMMAEREKEAYISLVSDECEGCGTKYLIKIARCKKCGSDHFRKSKLADTGVVYSHTLEHYFPCTFPPVSMLVIDLVGGGRMTVQQTDTYDKEISTAQIGDRVRLVIRKISEKDSKPNYYYKAIKIS